MHKDVLFFKVTQITVFLARFFFDTEYDSFIFVFVFFVFEHG